MPFCLFSLNYRGSPRIIHVIVSLGLVAGLLMPLQAAGATGVSSVKDAALISANSGFMRSGNSGRIKTPLSGVESAGDPSNVQPAIPTGYSEYYIPGGSEQLYALLQDNDSTAVGGNGNNMNNVITISIAAPVTIYYDHWEGGYNTGSNANHLGALFDEKYTAVKGDVLTFTSPTVPSNPRGTTLTACAGSTVVRSGNGSTTTLLTTTNCYDGRDYMYMEGGAVSVAQAFWPSALGTVYANAWEIYPTKPYQTDYTIPVGLDLYYNQGDIGFYHVYALIQATQDGTILNVDNKNPSPSRAQANDIVNLAMSKGQVTQVWDVYSGTTVSANHPVQVQFIIGEDLVTPSQSDSRSYTAVPSALWESAYYSPVPSFDNAGVSPAQPDVRTDLYIYNPTASPLTINWQFNSASVASPSLL